MGEPYLWRTANMSWRMCVVVKQMQSNPIQFITRSTCLKRGRNSNFIGPTEASLALELLASLVVLMAIPSVSWPGTPGRCSSGWVPGSRRRCFRVIEPWSHTASFDMLNCIQERVKTRFLISKMTIVSTSCYGHVNYWNHTFMPQHVKKKPDIEKTVAERWT